MIALLLGLMSSSTGVVSLAAPPVKTAADWLKRPTSDELNAVWPVKASERGVGGKTTVTCIVTTAGALANCSVLSESPRGFGFGEAALLLTPSFVMKPATSNGVPEASKVAIPINFSNEGGLIPGERIKIATWLPWSATPSYAELAAARPASGAAGSAHVVMRCDVKRNGRLEACATIAGRGYARQAQRLFKEFQVSPAAMSAQPLENTYINLAMQFPASTGVSGIRYVNEADWTRLPDPSLVAKIYPRAAQAAGVRRGRTLLDCNVGETGYLQHCEVLSETPDAMGFGKAAVAVATTMSVNLWSRDGLPTYGGHVKLPLTLVAPDDLQPQPSAAAAPADHSAASSSKPSS